MDEKRLLGLPLFGGLGKRGRRLLARRADEIDVPEGKELAREGEFAYEFFLIVSGTAQVTRDGRHVRDLGPGDFFGEIGILASEHRIASVTATSPMELVVLTSGALRSIAREEPTVARTITNEIDRRLSGARVSAARRRAPVSS